MFRKRRQPTPHFRQPPPYNPIGGTHHIMRAPGIYPYVAMVQVAREDTKRDYVVCRGFDIRINKFVDDPPGMSVAKPYGNRVVGAYQVAQVYAAVLPMQFPDFYANQTGCPSPIGVKWRVGQNPGVAAVTEGHPADLDEEILELYDDDGLLINWMLIDSGTQQWYIGKVVDATITAGSTGTVEEHEEFWSGTGREYSVYNPHDIDLEVDLKVRWTRYPGWTGWIVEPWHFTVC